MWLNIAVENWQVTVYTGNQVNAGTNADIYLTIFGNKTNTVSVKTDAMLLDSTINNFELGAVDVFRIETIKLVKPYKITVFMDKNGLDSLWHWYFLRVSI